jgi:hypothetical protein
MNLKSYTLSDQLLRLVDLREKSPRHSLDSKQRPYSSCIIHAELGQSEREDHENFIFLLLSLSLSSFWGYAKNCHRQT